MIQNRSLIEFYEQSDENERLKFGLGPLELERTRELITRHLPTESAKILDVGGGPGIHAAWLAELGHDVTLLDPVPRHIDLAKNRARRIRNPYNSVLGDARELPFGSESADLLILHGPLYHLPDEADRMKALKEAWRVLRPGANLLAFAINYTASTLVGLLQGILNQADFLTMVREELTSGDHRAPENMIGAIPEGHYHRPSELKTEIEAAGFIHQQTFPVEGMIWLDKNYFSSRGHEEKKKTMLDLLRLTENDPELLVFSPHVMAVATKPC